jgi:hypothetical protein
VKISGLFHSFHCGELHTLLQEFFLFELLKLKMYEVQLIKQQMQKWEFKMKIGPALK